MTRLPLAASQSRKPTGENVAVLHGPASLAHKHHLGAGGGGGGQTCSDRDKQSAPTGSGVCRL